MGLQESTSRAYQFAARRALGERGAARNRCTDRNGPATTTGTPSPCRPISRMITSIAAEIGCHTFRATGITAYLANGGALAHAQEMAAHESPRTTKLYDRTKERLIQDEVERIRL